MTFKWQRVQLPLQLPVYQKLRTEPCSAGGENTLEWKDAFKGNYQFFFVFFLLWQIDVVRVSSNRWLNTKMYVIPSQTVWLSIIYGFCCLCPVMWMVKDKCFFSDHIIVFFFLWWLQSESKIEFLPQHVLFISLTVCMTGDVNW